MRPSIGEVVANVRHVLRDVVAPSVTSEYVSAQLDTAMAALVFVEAQWADLPERLAQDNDELVALLSAAIAADLVEEAEAVAIDRAVVKWEDTRSLAAAGMDRVDACHVELRNAVTIVLRRLHDEPELPLCTPWRQRVRHVLLRQLID